MDSAKVPETATHAEYGEGGNEGAAVDSANRNWYEVRLAGKVPERRGYHSSFLHGNKLYIYGGHDIREGSLDNLWMIDLENFDDLDLMPEDQDKTCDWKLLPTKGT